ncbi:helix-turn-helix transcriptional regulator [Kiritimatiella glycovorans]|uniref:AraC family transcriptional regulator n=1 Tax=Kiritimatiella glycovorans TaxID=1307763 RepID=A0A0G3EMN7_9BACT|nr:helix-turn-helix transcriptional regulator [Kiritimatiella glycovorans]AKJ65369.1 AraC family transcriptional regulator [Kiritimatiella glycovorans]
MPDPLRDLEYINVGISTDREWTPGVKIPLHSGFHYILEGSYAVRAECFGARTLKRGDLLAVFADRLFMLEGRFRYLFLSIRGDGCVPFLRACGFTPEAPFCPGAPEEIYYPMHELLSGMHGGRRDHPFFFAARLMRIGEILRDRMMPADERRSTPPYAEQVRRVMEETEYRCEGVTEAAAHLAVSPDTLRRACRREMGVSAIEYLTRLRLERACKLLRKTSYKIAFIASACGYRSEKYFITAFRRRVGTTPARWRERHR